MTTALYLLRCVQMGVNLSDLEFLEIGMIFDMAVEESNDSFTYQELATQDDFDNF